MKRLVVLSGAGVSAESGLKTFRDSDGLWEGYSVYDVATPQAWQKNPKMVLEFYNERRRAVKAAEPNPGHIALAELEEHFKVQIITQNIDDLHERAGSTAVLHLHGEIFKARSERYAEDIYSINGTELNLGQKCRKGFQLRPHIVWFGESVPMIETAIEQVRQADIFLVVGTSLLVYPAASLIDFVPRSAAIFIIDPKTPQVSGSRNYRFIAERASFALPKVKEELIAKGS